MYPRGANFIKVSLLCILTDFYTSQHISEGDAPSIITSHSSTKFATEISQLYLVLQSCETDRKSS
jgi:hypothetical protein